jgi:hypothetical protein
LIGEHKLQLEVTTNGTSKGPYVASDTLTVVPEQISSSWWQWDGDRSRDAAWKEAYALGGVCINRNNFSAMQFTIDLVEKDDSGATKVLETITAGPSSSNPRQS